MRGSTRSAHSPKGLRGLWPYDHRHADLRPDCDTGCIVGAGPSFGVWGYFVPIFCTACRGALPPLRTAKQTLAAQQIQNWRRVTTPTTPSRPVFWKPPAEACRRRAARVQQKSGTSSAPGPVLTSARAFAIELSRSEVICWKHWCVASVHVRPLH